MSKFICYKQDNVENFQTLFPRPATIRPATTTRPTMPQTMQPVITMAPSTQSPDYVSGYANGEANVRNNEFKPLMNDYKNLKTRHEATLQVLTQMKNEVETARQAAQAAEAAHQATQQALEQAEKQAAESEEYGYQKGYQDGQARCGERKSYYDTEYNEK